MRKFLLQLAAGAMMVGSLIALPSAAVAAPAVDLVDFCKNAVGPSPQPKDEGTIGECSSLFILFGLEKDGLPTHVCKLWLERGQLGDFGYTSFADCVRGEHDFFNE